MCSPRLKAHDRGLRQSELLALTWADADLDGAKLTVHRSKTRSGVRDVALDAGTVDVLRRHRKRQLEERLAAFGAYDDHDLLFCREDGSPFPYRQRVTFDFKRRARELGLPVIRFHDLRHTAATLNLEAGVDIKVVSDLLDHATQRSRWTSTNTPGNRFTSTPPSGSSSCCPVRRRRCPARRNPESSVAVLERRPET